MQPRRGDDEGVARIGKRRLALAAVAVAGLAAAIAIWPRAGSAHHDQPVNTAHLTGTSDYLPGVAADLYLPSTPGSARKPVAAPVVVLVPGGGWQTADRLGLGPLAETLARRGMVVVNATYRAAVDHVLFPQPVADIVCAVDYAADRARRAGYRAAPLVVLGHSSGAHLASLAALAGTHFRERCPYPPVQPDGFVGLAGPYDMTAFSDAVRPLFGASQEQAPAAWHDGNPYTWVRSRPGLAVLLAAGDHDDLVSWGSSMAFAAALRDAGHRVRLDIVPGATHFDIYTPGVIASTVATWIATVKPG